MATPMPNQAEKTLYPVEPDILRFRLQQVFPYFHSVLYHMVPKPAKGLRTFAVDPRGRWYYDEEGVPFDKEEQLFALYHEIGHLIRGHATRMGARDNRQWNVAGDCEINDWVPPGFKAPDTMMFPKRFNLPDEELAEWYYDRIDQWDLHARVDASAADPGSGACETDPSCDSKDKDPVIAKKTYNVTKGVKHVPKCGAVGPPDDSSEGEEGDISEIEMESIRRQVAEDVKAAGNAPGGLARWAQDYLEPKLDWRKLLRTTARRAAIIIQGHTEQTFQRPSRRQIKPFLLPKRVAKKVTTAFYIDTSGSIGNDELNQAMSEVMAAVSTGQSDFYVTFVDHAVYPTTKVTSVAQVRRVEAQGGGGTDMRLCFEHVKTLKTPKPNLVVIVTDGFTPWPDHDPGIPTIIALSQKGQPTPSWAKEVVME